MGVHSPTYSAGITLCGACTSRLHHLSNTKEGVKAPFPSWWCPPRVLTLAGYQPGAGCWVAGTWPLTFPSSLLPLHWLGGAEGSSLELPWGLCFSLKPSSLLCLCPEPPREEEATGGRRGLESAHWSCSPGCVSHRLGGPERVSSSLTWAPLLSARCGWSHLHHCPVVRMGPGGT